MKPNFINNSNLRQERLRERKRRRANMSRQQQGHVEKRDSSKHIIPSDENVLGFVKIGESKGVRLLAPNMKLFFETSQLKCDRDLK